MNEKLNTNYLTSIRGLACLIVVIAHLLATVPQIGINVSGCGKIGVWLFFVLSALLLTTQMLKKKTLEKEDIIKFYVKRIFRIFPCYTIVLFLSLVIGYLPNISAFFKHIFLLEGFGHFWTIPVECTFYLIIPILIFIIKKINNNKKSILFLLGLLLISAFIFPFTKYEENSINLKWYIPVFLMGMIISFYYLKSLKSNKNTIICDYIFLLIMAGLLVSIPYVRNLLFKIEPNRYLQNKYLFVGFTWCVAILSIQNSKYVIKFLNKSKFLKFVGNISFPLYLVHYVLLSKIQTMNLIINFILVIVLSSGLAIVMNKFVEQKMLMVAKKLIQKIEDSKKKRIKQ